MALKTPQGAGWLKDIGDNFATIGERGSYTAVAGDATADTVDIDTGKSDATLCIVQIYRAGVQVTADAAISIAAGVITVADGASTYAITADDVITWIAF